MLDLFLCSMINVYLRKYVFYLIGILIFSLVVNLGTALDDIWLRMKKPMFQQVLIATIALFHCYLYFIQRMSYRLLYICPWYKTLHTGAKFPVFILLCSGPVLLIHVLILNFLLAQRNHGSIFNWEYFQTDFWFFFIPLTCYVISVYYSPQVFLFRVPNEKKVQLSQQENSSTTAAVEIGINAIDQESWSLKLWEESRVIKFVFEYYQIRLQKQEWNIEGNIPLWKIVFFQKTATITFAYFVNGEKWGLHHFNNTILDNPWVVKINQSSYVNMLYVPDKSDYRIVLKVSQKNVDGTTKENRVEIVRLYATIRTALDLITDPEKLDLILMISRRMKDKHYAHFWKNDHQQQLHISDLEEGVGRIR